MDRMRITAGRLPAAVLLLILGTPTARAWGQATPAVPAAPGALAPEVLKKVKQATVRLRVALPNRSVNEGSGFFGVEPGLVLTNAHVLGMFRGESRRPSKIEVIVHSGERDERTLPGRVLGVDTASDLAVLRVEAPELPAPLAVKPAEGLLETQTVYVFGFPFGASLGRAITVNSSSVSSLRRNDAGVLQRVQVNGGMNPGNSGGPVVDAAGNVVGVAVAVISQTQISFAVPGESVHALLAGRVQEVTLGQPYKDGDDVKSAIQVRLLDPLNRVRKAALVCWAGPAAKSRAQAPPEPPADSPKRRAIDLEIKQGVAKAELTLPKADSGDVFWVRPVLDDESVPSRKWLPFAWPVKTAVERTPVVLELKPKTGARFDLELVNNTTLTLRDANSQEHALALNLSVGLVEEIVRADDDGATDVHLRFTKVTVGNKLDGKPLPRDEQMRKVLPNLFRVGVDLRVDGRGTLLENRLDLTKVAPSARTAIGGVAGRIKQALEAVELPLPGKLTQANAPWTGRRDLPIETPGDDQTGEIDMKYWYLGRRERNGVNEALVEMSGGLTGRRGNTQGIGGRVQGLAFLDLDAGRVMQANVTTYLDMDVVVNGEPGKANGKIEVRLTRKPAAEKAASK